MNTSALVTRTLEILEEDALFYAPGDLVANGLNPAQLLLVALKPNLLTKRTVISLLADEIFLDLRVVAPRLLKLQRLVLGDVSGEVAVKSQGFLEDLRQTSLESLRSHRRWMIMRDERPQMYYRHGAFWRVLWPRSFFSHTLTLVYSAMPANLNVLTPNIEPEIPAGWQDVLPKVASALMLLKEGGAQSQKAVQRLSEALGEEPFADMRRAVAAAERRALMMAGQTDGNA